MFGGWRGLRRFWAIVLLAVLTTAGALQLAGPPRPRSPVVVAAKPVEHPPAVHEPAVVHQTPAAAPAAGRPGRDTPGPVNDPDPALLEPVHGSPADVLPRISPDGRQSMQYYASGFDPTTLRPRVGLMIAGMALGSADSRKAITDLPGEITFAVSPYAANAEVLLSLARLAGHEYLLSIPMEPLRFPLSDPGPNALMTTLPPPDNMTKLLWAMARSKGYVGATSILGELRGERLIDVPEQMNPVLAEFARRGLLYVGPPSQPAPVLHVWNRTVDLIVDEPTTAAAIDAQLAALETLARDRGSALGLAVAPRPVTVARIAAWTTGLLGRGLALAPVSALMRPPAKEQDTPR